MTVKSIIDVEINDGPFKEFQKLFDKYQAALKKQPDAWKKIGAEAKKAADEIAAQGTLTEEANKNLDEAAKQQSKLKTLVAGTNREFNSLAKSSKSIAGNFKDATFWLLKWGGIATAFGGLLGGGGLFGINRLAAAASSGRRESQGFGVNVGALKAVRNNYGSAVDVDSLLNKINDARNDATKRWLFSANGISAGDIANKDNAQILQQLIPNLKSRFAQSNGNAANMPGLTDFADVDTLTRLKSITAEEIKAMEAATAKDQAAFALTDKTQESWQTFQKQLSRAGDLIETTFIKGLLPLTGPLANLSASFANTLKDTLSNPNMGHWIEQFGTGIQKLATYIGSPEFGTGIEKFANGITEVGTALYNFAAWANKLLGKDEPAAPGAPTYGTYNGKPFPYADKTINPLFESLERQRGLPAGTLDRLYEAESSRGWNIRSHIGNESSNAPIGPFQFDKATGKQYGITDRHDLKQAATGAAAYLADLRNRYHGDMAKAVAAYNYGPGNLDELIKTRGDNWLQYAPKETQGEVSKVLTVNINNNTGGNAVVNANQAAQAN